MYVVGTPQIEYAEHLDFRGCKISHMFDSLQRTDSGEAEMPVHGPAVAAAIRARLGSGVEAESVMRLDESHQMALALDSGREML